MARAVIDAATHGRLAQRAEQLQRVHMAVERAVDRADHVLADIGQAPLGLGVIEDLIGEIGQRRLVVQAAHRIDALAEFRLREAEHEAARLAVGDVDFGLRAEDVGEPVPVIGGAARPQRVFGHAKPFDWTQTSAKLPREARKATSPSSRMVTRAPLRARPSAIAPPTTPPPMTTTSGSLVLLLGDTKIQPFPVPTNSRSSPKSLSSAISKIGGQAIRQAETAAMSGSILSWM
jgi:hypothetical protein